MPVTIFTTLPKHTFSTCTHHFFSRNSIHFAVHDTLFIGVEEMRWIDRFFVPLLLLSPLSKPTALLLPRP